jgi:hypothetical protein
MVDERFSIAVYFIQWNDMHVIISRILRDDHIRGLLSVDVRIESDAVDFVFKPIRFTKSSNHHQKFPSLRGGRRSLTGWIMYPNCAPLFSLSPDGAFPIKMEGEM